MIGIGKSDGVEAEAEAEVENQLQTKVELEAEADREKSDIQAAMMRTEDREIIHIIDAVKLRNVNITHQMGVPVHIETSTQPTILQQI